MLFLIKNWLVLPKIRLTLLLNWLFSLKFYYFYCLTYFYLKSGYICLTFDYFSSKIGCFAWFWLNLTNFDWNLTIFVWNFSFWNQIWLFLHEIWLFLHEIWLPLHEIWLFSFCNLNTFASFFQWAAKSQNNLLCTCSSASLFCLEQ